MAKSDLDETKKLMGALVRMEPKPHEAMKVGKAKAKKAIASSQHYLMGLDLATPVPHN